MPAAALAAGATRSSTHRANASRRCRSVEPEPGRTLDHRIELQHALERRLELGHRPGARLLRELLGPERVAADRLHDVRRPRPLRDEICRDEQLPEPPVEHDGDDRLRRRLEQPVERGRRDGDPPLGDGVEERPGGVGHDLRDERPDVLLPDRVAGPVERELLELRDRERALALPVHVALA